MALPGGRAIHKLTNSKKCKKLTQPYSTQFYVSGRLPLNSLIQMYD
jgi:hypothetical protein